MSSPPDPARPRPKRLLPRLIKWIGFGVFYWLLAEGGAYVVLRQSLAGVPLYRKMEIARESTGAVSVLKLNQPASIRQDGIHPFVGYLPRSGRRFGPKLSMFHDQGFYNKSSAVYSQDPNDLVVAITGGSVAGQFSQFGGPDELGPLLAAMPKYEGRNIRFVAMAAGGFKQPQQLMSLNWVLAIGGRVDMLINIDGYNEVVLHEGENQPHDVSIFYPRAWYPRIEGLNTAATAGELQYRRRQRALALKNFDGSPLKWSPLRSLLWLRKDTRMQEENVLLEKAVRNVRNKGKRDVVAQGPPNRGKNPGARAEDMADLWLRCSQQLDRICRVNNIEYFHFLQPNQYLEGTKVMGEKEKAVAIGGNQRRSKTVNLGFPKLAARAGALTESGVRFHDLRDVFLEVEEPIYKDICCHVNPLGNMYMARAIAAAIGSW